MENGGVYVVVVSVVPQAPLLGLKANEGIFPLTTGNVILWSPEDQIPS